MKAIVLMVLSAVLTRSFQQFRYSFAPNNYFKKYAVLRMSSLYSTKHVRSMDEIAVSENSFQKYLKQDSSVPLVDGSKVHPRQVTNAHFSCVLPEKVKAPYLISYSSSCMNSLEIAQEESTKPEFVQYFSGNQLIPGMNEPYTTVYGTHSGGHWFGQMGDGRAIYLGETHVTNPEKEGDDAYYSLQLRELQLKGAGRSPFSRGFDGRAVLRSSIREFLVSESMHHLRVPTTRALTLIGTSQAVRRPWYHATSQSNPYSASTKDSHRKFPPDTMMIEPGAIVCRVSRSFLRFGHLEIFGHRKELSELVQMADYMCLREYPHLLETDTANLRTELPPSITPGLPTRYLGLFRAITDRVAYLVAQWLRVGYVQGNMNTDNTLVGGRTMDYGPFGWMEKFDPFYQPFTSDSGGQFAFLRQPIAMGVNLQSLASSAFQPLLQHIAKDIYPEEFAKLHIYQQELERIAEEEYERCFTGYYQEVQRNKLGLSLYDAEGDKLLWNDLLSVMSSVPCDYTIFFRELSQIEPQFTAEQALQTVQYAFYRPSEEEAVVESSTVCSRPTRSSSSANSVKDETHMSEEEYQAWLAWMQRYLRRLQTNGFDAETRRQVMNRSNPKFVLRNWMSTMAYEQVLDSDGENMAMIQELQAVLADPYAEQSPEISRRWYRRTPLWAEGLPGVSFFSCSS